MGSISVLEAFFQFSTRWLVSPMGWISSVELLSYGNYTLVSIRMEVSGTSISRVPCTGALSYSFAPQGCCRSVILCGGKREKVFTASKARGKKIIIKREFDKGWKVIVALSWYLLLGTP